MYLSVQQIIKMRLNTPIQSLVGRVTTSLSIYNCVIFSNSIIFSYSVSSSAKTFLVELSQRHNELMCECRGWSSLSVHFCIPWPHEHQRFGWLYHHHTHSFSAFHLRCIHKCINAEENRSDALLNLRPWGSTWISKFSWRRFHRVTGQSVKIVGILWKLQLLSKPHLSHRQPEICCKWHSFSLQSPFSLGTLKIHRKYFLFGYLF